MLKKNNYRKFLGEGLDASSIEELQQLENQLERSLTKIRAKKVTYISLIIYFDRWRWIRVIVTLDTQKKRVIVTLSTFKSMTLWLGRLITYIQGNNHRTIFRRWPYSYKLFKEFIQLFYFLIAVPITAWRTGQVERKGKTHKPLAFFFILIKKIRY